MTPTRSSADAEALRFAFYGHASTTEIRDRLTSFGWQRHLARGVITDAGTITAEFFDVGFSRLPWRRRPQAGALLAALHSSRRSFDAVVVGDFERAFIGDRMQQVLPIFARQDMPLWLPETDGPVVSADPAHRALIMLLGARTRRDELRMRHQVLMARRRPTGSRNPLAEGQRDALPAISALASDALAALIGSTRTAVLEAVAEQHRTTTDLARRVGVSAASASEHTAVLRQAGLIVSQRHGNRMLHHPTALGLELLDG